VASISEGNMAPVPLSEGMNRGHAPAKQGRSIRAETQQVVRSLERAFSQSFAVVDGSTGDVIHSDLDRLNCDLYTRLAACEAIAQRGRPELLDEVAPLVMLAVPLPVALHDPPLVAVSTFVTEPVDSESQIAAAAHEFGVDAGQAYRWAQGQRAWHPEAALQLSQAVLDRVTTQQQAAALKHQLTDISSHLLNTFEEITLLHRLTEHLSLSKSVTELCELSVTWLADVIPAECMAIWLNSVGELGDQQSLEDGSGAQSALITHGTCPLAEGDVRLFIERLGPRVNTDPLVLNRVPTSSPTWFYPSVRELISVPIREGDNIFGWLLAMNHQRAIETVNSEAEFGTVEASLMASVAVILGIHSGNVTLYRNQSSFFASMVRALTSAIDAKDPYTCGHSDRVARLAVCLARQVGCTTDELDTIYLSGLLHDIGKIGIDDTVLRKPGPLTDAELQHIKTHPELGCRILDGIKQLDKVLPVVLHHHEAWDGSGYPDKLAGEDCPKLARIVAVADSIDAMSSDRPYRKGIPDAKLDAILRQGAGKQWDARIVDAVFQVRDELRRIGQDERKPLSLDVAKW
jgi:HD-GYP domain-containing protein (c-di-GMP phosphodiesterase class II)